VGRYERRRDAETQLVEVKKLLAAGFTKITRRFGICSQESETEASRYVIHHLETDLFLGNRVTSLLSVNDRARQRATVLVRRRA
jgi:hypothetical protein